MNYLLVIDMQHDFVDGSLGTPEAEAIVPAVVNKIKNHSGPILLTRDTHPAEYLQTQEGAFLPVPHCIEGTKGWEIIEPVMEALEGKEYRLIDKPTFGSTTLANLLSQEAEQGKIDSIEFIGLCTDICVISNALLVKAFLPEMPLFVDAACCAGVTPEKHASALEVLGSCQVTLR